MDELLGWVSLWSEQVKRAQKLLLRHVSPLRMKTVLRGPLRLPLGGSAGEVASVAEPRNNQISSYFFKSEDISGLIRLCRK